MVPSLIRIVSTLKSLIEDKVNVGESKINLTPHISKASLDIIGSVGFGYEFNSLTSPNKLAGAYDFLINSPLTVSRIILRSFSNYFPFARKLLPFSEYKKYSESCEILEQTSWQLVEEKYRLDKNNELNRKDLLSLLINTNKTLPVEERLTDDELKSQIMTILVAGHGSTTVAICWALYLLAKYPHDQDLLREELIKAFPDKSKFNPTFDEINSLEYLNCIVKETLRLHNPVTSISRTNNNDITLGEYFIPKNTVILVAISALHRSTSIWGTGVQKIHVRVHSPRTLRTQTSCWPTLKIFDWN